MCHSHVIVVSFSNLSNFELLPLMCSFKMKKKLKIVANQMNLNSNLDMLRGY